MLSTSAMMRSRTSTRGEPVSAAKTSPNRAIPKAPPDGELERSLFWLLVFFSFLVRLHTDEYHANRTVRTNGCTVVQVSRELMESASALTKSSVFLTRNTLVRSVLGRTRQEEGAL